MDARAYLRELAPTLDAALDAALPKSSESPESLHRAMRHLFFPAGKYLRPALALAACEAVGGARDRALPLAVAAELVHAYSLVHDDLPCMDDDDLRRGRPSVHVAFGEATAVLAGDALQTLAFEVLAAAPGDPARLLAASAELARAAGSRELVGGQVLDLDFAARGDAAAIEDVHARKSAALIAACTAGGALLGGAAPERVAALRRFGRAVGVAFQIADDLLDAGEDTGCTLLSALTPAQALARADALLGEALALIDDLGEAGGALRELARYAVRRSE
jgi:geranylgeranyl diphosphate synthase type II